jgi:hypothetical protein
MEIKEIILFSITMEMDFLPATISETGYPNKTKKVDTSNDVSLSSFVRQYSFL